MWTMEMMGFGRYAIPTTNPHHGLLLILAVRSLSKELRYSTVLFMVAELGTLISAFPTSFQLPEARCSLGVSCLAILLVLPMMGNISSYQVKTTFLKYFLRKDISGHQITGRFVIVQMDNGPDPLNLEEVKAFGRLVPGGNSIKIKLQGCEEDFLKNVFLVFQ